VSARANPYYFLAQGGSVMKKSLFLLALLSLPTVAAAEVRHVEIDVAGYLCGL